MTKASTETFSYIFGCVPGFRRRCESILGMSSHGEMNDMGYRICNELSNFLKVTIDNINSSGRFSLQVPSKLDIVDVASFERSEDPITNLAVFITRLQEFINGES